MCFVSIGTENSLLIRYSGNFDDRDCEELVRLVQKNGQAHVRHVILNLEGVGFMRSAGAAVVMYVHKLLEEANRKLVIVNPPLITLNLLRLAGVDKVVEIVDSDTAAIKGCA